MMKSIVATALRSGVVNGRQPHTILPMVLSENSPRDCSIVLVELSVIDSGPGFLDLKWEQPRN